MARHVVGWEHSIRLVGEASKHKSVRNIMKFNDMACSETISRNFRVVQEVLFVQVLAEIHPFSNVYDCTQHIEMELVLPELYNGNGFFSGFLNFRHNVTWLKVK
jgi:hypothetical protein